MAGKGLTGMTRDPNSYIAASAEHLAETLTKKNADYAPTGEFSNFERAAEVAGISVLQLITAQIAIKMTRIDSLMGTPGNPKVVQNESLADSFLDLAGYSVIVHAYLSANYSDLSIKPFSYVATEDRETIRNSADDMPGHHHVWNWNGGYDECLGSGCFIKRDAKGFVYE